MLKSQSDFYIDKDNLVNKNKVLDLFCGCGGLSHGFIEVGYEVVAGIDHWQDALDTFAF